MKAFDRVTIARSKDRITSMMFIDSLCDEFIEFHGDRNSKDDESIVGGIGIINNRAYTIIGVRKGKNLEENMRFNFGMPSPEGYRKALRLMKQAEKFKRPILIFVDTPGAYCGVEAEEKGQGEAIGRNLIEMAVLKVPIISVITGEGGSGGALALAVSDRVWMLENSIYSILSPEGFASILWKDASKAKEAAEVMKITSYDLKELEVIDDIILEPENLMEDKEVQEDFMVSLKEKLLGEFESLRNLKEEELLEDRYNKFRNI